MTFSWQLFLFCFIEQLCLGMLLGGTAASLVWFCGVTTDWLCSEPPRTPQNGWCNESCQHEYGVWSGSDIYQHRKCNNCHWQQCTKVQDV